MGVSRIVGYLQGDAQVFVDETMLERIETGGLALHYGEETAEVLVTLDIAG